MNKNFIFLGVVMIVVVALAVSQRDNIEPAVEQVAIDGKEEVNEKEVEHESGHVDHHLHEAEVTVSGNSLTAGMSALGLVPLENESGAVGYGVITSEGTDAVVVSATHAGVLDSELQKDASDPVWHNHVVKLGEVALCGEDPGVIDITFESPGSVTIDGSELVMVDIPNSFTGSHSLNQSKLVFNHGTDVEKVVEFTLDPKFNEAEELQAVCVTNIKEIPFNLI